MIEEEKAYLRKLKHAQDGGGSPRSLFENNPSDIRPKNVFLNENWENYPASQVNCELIQMPRRLKIPHFIEEPSFHNSDANQSQMETSKPMANTLIDEFERSEHYASARILNGPNPLKKPSLDGLFNHLNKKMADIEYKGGDDQLPANASKYESMRSVNISGDVTMGVNCL